MKIKNYWMILAIALISLCTISCGSDDDNNKENNGISIVGTWVDGSTTIVFGSDGSYNLTNTSVPSIPQYRKGNYSYNASQNLLTINVQAVTGQNGAYQQTYIVQTLTSTTLVLLYIDGDVEGYYTRK